MKMLSIAYVSAASTEMSEDDIQSILLQSRKNNTRLGLTGALLFDRGRFIQILEGPDEVVLERFRIISADVRHRNMRLMSEEPVTVRQFPEWTMGYSPVSMSAAKAIDGFEDFFGRTGRERLKHVDNSAQAFLEWLSEYWFAIRK